MSLSVSSEEFADLMSKDTQHMVAELAYKVAIGVSMRTPVDTGQTRKSWNLSKNRPDFSTVDDGVGHGLPSFNKLRFRVGEYPIVFVSNGKRHVGYLESGTSKQAPNGMVAVTLAGL